MRAATHVATHAVKIPMMPKGVEHACYLIHAPEHILFVATLVDVLATVIDLGDERI